MAKSKKKIKISKVPKYNDAGATPSLDPTTGLPTQPQVPYGLIGGFAGAGVDAFGQDDPTGKGYIGTKVGSNALRGAGMGASVGQSFGPYGAAIGAGVGALGFGALGAVQAKKDRKEAIEENTANDFAVQQEVYQARPNFFKMGGMPIMNTIETEGPELEVQKGKILKDFKNMPKHSQGGYQYEAKPGRVIIRGKDAEKYKSSDQFTRNSMEREHVMSQKMNEQMTDEYKRGGKINFKSKGDYSRWLGYVHSTGLAESTPGHQKVSIRGKKVKVKHEDGGYTVPKFQGGGIKEDETNPRYKGGALNPLTGLRVDPTQTQGSPYSFSDNPSDLSGPFAQNISGKTIQLDQNQMGAFYQEPEPIVKRTIPTEDFSDPVISATPYNFRPRNYSFGVPKVNIEGSDLASTPKSGDTYDRRFDPAKQQPNWNQMGVNAATWAPAAYNAFMAFQKPVKEKSIYNPHEYEALKTLRDRKIDMDPIRRDIYSQERVASAPLGESQGSYLSRRTQLSANTQKALTDAQLKAQGMNLGFQADYAGALDTFGQQRRSADYQARQATLAGESARGAYLPKALEQVSYLSQAPYREKQYLDAAREVNKYSDLVSDLQTGRKTREQAEKEALERGKTGRYRYASSTGSLYIP